MVTKISNYKKRKIREHKRMGMTYERIAAIFATDIDIIKEACKNMQDYEIRSLRNL